MYLENDTVMGEMVGGARRPVRAFSAGRVCAEPGCDVVLSIYNSRESCAAHDFDATLCGFRVPPVQPHPGQAARRHRGPARAAAPHHGTAHAA